MTTPVFDEPEPEYPDCDPSREELLPAPFRVALLVVDFVWGFLVAIGNALGLSREGR